MLHIVTQYLKELANLIDSKVRLTYETALSQAEKIAYQLTSRSILKKPIAVMMDKGAMTVTAFLGVALSGNYYTAIDAKVPQNRVEKILETFKPSLSPVDKRNVKKAEDLGT